MVNEKTLEMNVSTNMITSLRTNHPNAFLYGFTMQYDEPRNALDSSLNLPGNHRLLCFQFKKPRRGSGNIFWFNFNNNTRFNQHNILHVTADATQPNSTVFYALPAYTNMNSFENDSPDFLNNTYFIDVFDTPLIFDQRVHQFEIDIQNLTFQIHSKSKLGNGKIFTWNSIKEKFSSEKIGIDASTFKNKVLEFSERLPASLTIHEDYNRTDPLTSKVFLKSLVL